MQTADIEHRFAFHSAAGDVKKQEGHTYIRTSCAGLAHELNSVLPDGREKSTAITKLEEAMFWANAGLARGSEVRF